MSISGGSDLFVEIGRQIGVLQPGNRNADERRQIYACRTRGGSRAYSELSVELTYSHTSVQEPQHDFKGIVRPDRTGSKIPQRAV